MAQLALALLDEVGIGFVHIPSPSFTKYSSPRHVRPSFTMNGDHDP